MTIYIFVRYIYIQAVRFCWTFSANCKRNRDAGKLKTSVLTVDKTSHAKYFTCKTIAEIRQGGGADGEFVFKTGG